MFFHECSLDVQRLVRAFGGWRHYTPPSEANKLVNRSSTGNLERGAILVRAKKAPGLKPGLYKFNSNQPRNQR